MPALIHLPRRRSFAGAAMIVLTAGAVAFAPAAAHAATRKAPATCANADLTPATASVGKLRAAVLCLQNVDRVKHGLAPLKESAKLRKAALAHSTDMVRRSYFAHTSRGGSTFVTRIVKAGYVRRAGAWTLGENLAWGTGELGTARAVQKAWMRSRGHRANILKPGYREIGIGIRLGVPSNSGVGATFTTDFGRKS